MLYIVDFGIDLWSSIKIQLSNKCVLNFSLVAIEKKNGCVCRIFHFTIVAE